MGDVVKAYKLSIVKWISSEGLVCNMIAIVHTVLYSWNLLWVDCDFSPHTHTELVLWDDGCANYLDLGNYFTMYMCIKS